MRLIFAGTPDFAVAALSALIAAKHEVALVLTQPDRPAGRGMRELPSPVKRWAQQHGIEVFQPVSLKSPEAQSQNRGCESERHGRRGLRFDFAASGARHAALRLHQCACVAAAALARRRAYPARDSRGRPGDRHHHHANGRGARYRADAAGR